MRFTGPFVLRWTAVLLAAVLPPGAPLVSQPGCDTSRITIDADLAKRRLPALPFDVPFTLRVPVPALTPNPGGRPAMVDSIKLQYGPSARVGEGFGVEGGPPPILRFVQGRVPPAEVTFPIIALEANDVHYFDFFVYATKPVTVPSDPPRFDTVKVATFDAATATFTQRDSVARRESVVNVSTAVDTVRLIGTSGTTFANHFDADAGVLWAPGFGYFGVGTNSHFYFRPVNRNQCIKTYEGLDHVLKRVSIFAGVSLFKIHSDTEVTHLWTNASPVVGIGVNRLPLVPARLNAGIIWLRQEDPNPLVTRHLTKRDFFISTTIDFELRSLVGPLVILAGLR